MKELKKGSKIRILSGINKGKIGKVELVCQGHVFVIYTIGPEWFRHRISWMEVI